MAVALQPEVTALDTQLTLAGCTLNVIATKSPTLKLQLLQIGSDVIAPLTQYCCATRLGPNAVNATNAIKKVRQYPTDCLVTIFVFRKASIIIPSRRVKPPGGKRGRVKCKN